MDTDTRRGEPWVSQTQTQRQMAAETGFMLPQAEEILELPEAKRGREAFSPTGTGEGSALDFGLLASRTTRK